MSVVLPILRQYRNSGKQYWPITGPIVKSYMGICLLPAFTRQLATLIYSNKINNNVFLWDDIIVRYGLRDVLRFMWTDDVSFLKNTTAHDGYYCDRRERSFTFKEKSSRTRPRSFANGRAFRDILAQVAARDGEVA